MKWKKITIKEYKSRLRLVLKSKLNRKSKITAANEWALAVFRYQTTEDTVTSGEFKKQKAQKLKQN